MHVFKFLLLLPQLLILFNIVVKSFMTCFNQFRYRMIVNSPSLVIRDQPLIKHALYSRHY